MKSQIFAMCEARNQSTKGIGSIALINTKEIEMSAILSSLKFVQAKRPSQLPIAEVRRQKLNEKLKQQIAIADAQSRGENFSLKRIKKVTDRVSGQTSLMEVEKRAKTWWFTNNETKKIYVQLFYGNKVIELAKGKNAVEVSSQDELLATLIKLQQFVVDGSLDAQIEVASDLVKARFK